MNYLLHFVIYLDVFVIVALSLNLVVGYCGQLTVAHASYFAVGCYAYGLGCMRLGVGALPSMLLGVVVAAVLSLAVSLPSWRFKGDFFVMASLAVQSLVHGAMVNWWDGSSEVGTLANLTNGPHGLAGVPRPSIFGVDLDTVGAVAVFATVVTGLCAALCWVLTRSPWGRLLQAMRDDELALRGLGKNIRLVKLEAFALACGMAAVAGAVYASYIGFVEPGSGSLDQSILMLCMVIVGGVGNFRGPIVGALILLAIPEALRFTHIPTSAGADVRLLLYGVLLVAMMHFRPQGIAGKYRFE